MTKVYDSVTYSSFFLLCPSCNVLIKHGVSKVHSASETSSFIKKIRRKTKNRERRVCQRFLTSSSSRQRFYGRSFELVCDFSQTVLSGHGTLAQNQLQFRLDTDACKTTSTDVPLFTRACSRLFNTDFPEQSLSNTKVSSIDRYRPGWPTITLVVGKQLTGATEKKIVTSDP